MLTVRQVARASGVSIRTLHHYDEIGLLKPAHVGANRYRYYGRDELLRLQQILIHRELGMPLAQIAAMLDDPGFDRLKALHRQRERLAAEAQRFTLLVRTIDRTIASLEGKCEMKNAELYTGLTPGKQAEYEAWLVDRYGPGMLDRIEIGRQAQSARSDAEREAAMQELHDVEQALAEAMRRGIAADDPVLDPVLARQCDWVAAMWGRPCPPEAFAGLADLHLAHPDFVNRYESIGAGFSDYHAVAMKAWAERQSAA